MMWPRYINSILPKQYISTGRRYLSHFDPRFKYDNFNYQEHRVYVEQLLLRDKESYPTLSNQYDAFLKEINTWVSRTLKRSPSIFLCYARPKIREYSHEFWHQPFLLNFAQDLKKVGFSPFLDMLNFKETPENYMHKGIHNCDFVMIHGSSSLMHKLKNQPDAFVCTEVGYIISRNEKSTNKQFLLGTKLSSQHIKQCLPEAFSSGKIDVYEFADNDGNACRSYLEYLKDTIKRMLSFYFHDDTLLTDFDTLWEELVVKLDQHTYLSESAFYNNIGLFKKRDHNKQRSILEYILYRASLIDHKTFGLNDSVGILNVIKATFDRLIPWNMPPLPNDISFMNLQHDLKWIDTALEAQETMPRMLGFYGLPGVARMELLNQWCLINKDLVDAAFWFDASSEENLRMSCIHFFDEFCMHEHTHALSKKDSFTTIAEFIRNHFETQDKYRRWLIIFDKVSNPKILHNLLPRAGKGYIFLTATSRYRLGMELSTPYILEILPMSLNHGIDYFKKLTKKGEEQEKELDTLIISLGGLMQAIRCAADNIEMLKTTASDFLKDFQRMGSGRHVLNSLYVSWEEELKQFNTNKQKKIIMIVLKTLAYLSSKQIPKYFIKSIIRDIVGSSLCDETFWSVVTTLRATSMLHIEGKIHQEENIDPSFHNAYFSINPLFQKFLRDKYKLSFESRASNSTKSTDANFVMRLLAPNNVNYDQPGMQISVNSFDLLPHAEAFLKNVELGEYSIKNNNFIFDLYYLTAQLACCKLEYEKALDFYEKSKKYMPAGSQIEYKIAHAIGQVFLAMRRTKNDQDKAEDYLKEALRLAYNMGNRTSSDYAAILNDLARLYYDTGKYDESRIACEEVIQICKELSLPDIHFAYVKHDLGMAEFALGNATQAKIHYHASLTIKKKTFGTKSFPTIAATQLGLGQVYYFNGDIPKAKAYFLESLATSQTYFLKTVYPKSHIGIAAAHNDLGCCSFKLGMMIEACQHYLDSLKIYLGLSNQVKNLDCAIAIYNLALLTSHFGDEKLSQNLLYHAFHACDKDGAADQRVLKKISARVKWIEKNDSIPYDLNTITRQLEHKIHSTPAHEAKEEPGLSKNDLLLSLRYGFFRAIKPIISNTPHDQGLNLVLESPDNFIETHSQSSA